MDHYAKRTVTFRTEGAAGPSATIDAAELSTEIVGEVLPAEPGDYLVIHPDGSGEIVRPG